MLAAGRLPYLATALFALPVSSRPGATTMGIDTGWRLYADPVVVDEWPAREVAAVLVHLLSHVLRDHSERAREAGVDDLTADSWLLATDAEVNDDLRDAGFLSEAAPDLPSDFGAADDQLAERYLPLAARHRRRALLDCGSGADGRRRDSDERGPPGDDEGMGEGLEPFDKRVIQHSVAEEIRKARAEDPGSVPAGWARWAESQLAPRVDWRRELATLLRKAIASTAGAVDYTYSKPSRRTPRGSRVVFPSLHRPVPEVAVVCDTSASMSDELLARSLAELEGILSSVGVRRSLRVIACDAAVQSVRRVSHSRQALLAGGGGTDMGVGIAAALELRPRPSVIVILTDGLTPWPESRPKGVKVIVGMFEQGGVRHDWSPPDWARPVWIDEDDPGG